MLNKPAGDAAESASFTVRGAPPGLAALHAWRSTVVKGNAPDLGTYYNKAADVAVSADGSFRCGAGGETQAGRFTSGRCCACGWRVRKPASRCVEHRRSPRRCAAHTPSSHHDECRHTPPAAHRLPA